MSSFKKERNDRDKDKKTQGLGKDEEGKTTEKYVLYVKKDIV